MREIRQSGSEGGARFNPLSLPLSAPLVRNNRFTSLPEIVSNGRLQRRLR